MKYLFLIISLLLYLISPDRYSYDWCLFSMFLFILNATYIIITDRKIELIGFNLIFSATFFCCCYMFPVFVYQIDSHFSLFALGYNPSVMTRCTALSTFAYALYGVGYLSNKRESLATSYSSLCIRDKEAKYITILTLAVFILFFAYGGMQFFISMYTHATFNVVVVRYIYTLLFSLVILSCITLYYVNSLFTFFVVVGIGLIITITGSRTLPLAIALVLFYIFNSKRNIPILLNIAIIFFGVILFYAIGFARSGTINLDSLMSISSTKSKIGNFTPFADFIVVTRDLYASYSYVQEKGIVWTVFVGPILSVVPFAQSAFCSLFNIPSYQTGSAYFLTCQVLGPKSSLGVGTNIVGDVYLGGGIIGVIVLFYALGYIVSKARQEMIVKGDIVWTILYLVLLSDSVYMCRSALFGPLKDFVWSLVVIAIINHFVVHDDGEQYNDEETDINSITR